MADGTSKLTIDEHDFENYYIDYIPYNKQIDFINKKVKNFIKLKNKFLKAQEKFEKDLIRII